MKKFEGKTNNEIVLELKQLELDHESLKMKMLKDYDRLMDIESEYTQGNRLLNKRLRGEK